MEKELKWVTIISFIFIGFIMGAIVGRNTAPEKVRFIEKETEESITQAQFINAIKVCNAYASSQAYQLKTCKESHE